MKLVIDTKETINKVVADEFIKVINSKEHPVIGLATGSTPLGVYAELAKAVKEARVSFKKVHSFNLDEYVGLPITHPESYYAFMHRNLFNLIDIPEENTHVPSGLGDLEAGAKKYDEMIDASPVDCQILGIGSAGHIAFNEPGTAFDAPTHVTDLAESTIKDNARFFDFDMSKVPTQAVTQGTGTIMKAKNIIIICTGANKANAVKAMLEGPIDVNCPASILQKHDSVTVVLDEAAAALLTK